MLSRAFVKPVRRAGAPQTGEPSLRSSSIFEYEDFLFGFMDDIPLVSFNDHTGSNKVVNSTNITSSVESSSQFTLRQFLRASVGVMGESSLGMTEKVVLLGGKISAVKRFKRVVIRKNEFGRRIERVAQIGNQCEYLVPVSAYLYAKRIKFVVSDYYPMGTLADLLSGTKEQGHTALEWKHRYNIAQCIAKAIAFIHSQNPPKERHLKLNVHGNIKTSNVMIHVDFSARLSDYGFVQLAEHVAVDDTWQSDQLAPDPLPYEEKLSQESDVYNFGVVLTEILGRPDVKTSEVFDFCVEGEERKQAFNVLKIASSCRNSSPNARPNIERVLSCLVEI